MTQWEESGEFTIERDDEAALRFTGKLLAEVSSWTGQDAGRWTELRLYRTDGGRYIGEQVGVSKWEGEHDRHSAAVCDTTDDVVKFFGYGWLAKKLYAEAEIDTSEVVE